MAKTFAIVTILAVIISGFTLGPTSAASWSNKQQKDNAKKADVWSRFNDAEICEKLNLSKKGTKMRRMLNAERIKRHLKCSN